MKNEDILKKLLLFAKILTVIAVVNTILLLIAVGDNTSTTSKSSSTGSEETENTEYDVSMFEAISGNDFIKLLKGSGKGTSVIYLGRETCHYCVAFLPSMQKAQKEMGFTTKYLDITTVDEETAEKIAGLNDFLEENYGATPLVIVAKDGKYVDGLVGYTEYDEYIDFLKNAGVK